MNPLGRLSKPARQALVFTSTVAALYLGASTLIAQPVAVPPYQVSVFAVAPPSLTNPDSITVAHGNVFVTYANATNPDGTGGNSNVVEFSPAGQMLTSYTIVGKNDGLKFDPETDTIWALRNEDSNPALTIIDLKTKQTTDYTYATLPAHGGGYDDVLFLNGKIYISASNPILQPPTKKKPNGQNIYPSIVEATIKGKLIHTIPVLMGNASLLDVVTLKTVIAQQSDPDSLTVDPSGEILLSSQADGDLIFVNAPGTAIQQGVRLHLSDGTSNQVTVDDTVFPTTPVGTILVVDTKGDTVYAVKGPFQPGGAYCASDSDGALGKVDLSTGRFKAIVTGMQTPHGAHFLPGQ